ncbi:molybdate ABC transporter substrate-binding protein [Frigidibacter sp. MR17.14]|uniref:molybdate ABC transporter substrate-binding protein n=1 Tax=Frigidibacter sp. MR17.14 TaxID=3126509 RepID=UPI0030131D06
MLRALLVSASMLVAAAPLQAAELTVFAAASLKTALDDYAKTYEAKTGDSLAISYAGSSQLAKQIEAGAPADVFISAAENWMDTVETAGMIEAGTRHDLLGNTLVLIAHGKDAAPVAIGSDTDFKALIGQGKLAMALVDSVPAGQYGKAALQHLGQWDAVAPEVAQADNVRAALALVSTGEAPFGIVYATDAVADDNVTVAGTFSAESHPAIIYPAALVKDAKPEAKAFLDSLTGPEAKAAFEAQGFTVLGQ